MAHSTIILDTRSRKKDGTYPIKIRITHKGEFYINMELNVTVDQWGIIESKGNKSLKSGAVINHSLANRYNALIASRKLEIDKRLLSLSDSREILRMDNSKLKDYLLQDEALSKQYTFKEHYDKFFSSKSRSGTLNTLRNTYSCMSKFCNIDNLCFEDITYKWLQEFDKFMEDRGLSVNTRSVYMRNIRTLFNDAINCDEASLASYPFRKFKIKSERTAKRSLTIDQLRLLKSYPCQEHQRRYRDMFMLIFYMMGINMVDLVSLKEIVNGRVEYRRAKTGRLYSIKIEPEAMELIERYKGDQYLLNVCDNYGNYKDFLHRMNNNLKQIGEVELVENAAKDPKFVKKNKKSITSLFPDISSYWARHTWATIAASLDIPKETIAAALGHGGNDVTDIYIRFDEKKIDEANRKIIDYVNDSEKG